MCMQISQEFPTTKRNTFGKKVDRRNIFDTFHSEVLQTYVAVTSLICCRMGYRTDMSSASPGPIFWQLVRSFRNKKSAQRPKFSAGRPCGHPAKNFGQALQILGKQAFLHGHAARTSTKKLRSEKLRADFSLPRAARAPTIEAVKGTVRSKSFSASPPFPSRGHRP